MSSNKLQIEEIIDRALAEDLGKGDITTEALISGDRQGTAFIVAKKEGVLAGINVAKQVFHRVDPELKVEALLEDGARIEPGSRVAKVSGSIASILKAERIALNFLQRLSGIASETNRYVEVVKGLPVRTMDTRKTTPGLRSLEKHAVKAGGGENHRMSLGDGILIKDNHLAALRSQGLDIKEIIARARQNAPQRLPVEVEVGTVAEASEAVEAGADVVMLDNMNLEDMREAVKAIHGRALIEASGGITLDNVRAVAETGVDFISIGALTHSARALDISLELESQ
ncbi:MAG: carboxylating nicotinate-nucleotide diphosphorylase [Dehalococcoidia bacterium]|nr:carboxylating nicotinate-nucleotide diphosphorylase [Dehalococcoidia bacterium]MDH4290996.1 carboxylating nicotinate-nucleotide diphosphorylase [Dehalococcoidia bacterium]